MFNFSKILVILKYEYYLAVYRLPNLYILTKNKIGIYKNFSNNKFY